MGQTVVDQKSKLTVAQGTDTSVVEDRGCFVSSVAQVRILPPGASLV